MNMKVTCFLPCRAGSERVKNKNTRQFAGIEGGLLKIKLDQLVRCDLIDQILLSTDDQKVMDISKQFGAKVRVDIRPPHLASSDAKTDDLIKYVGSVIKEPHILWTHVTSPFTNEDIYKKAIEDYFRVLNSNENDSLLSVTLLRTHIWKKEGIPVNYDRKTEKWPRSQFVEPLMEVNSAIFINSRVNYINLEDRIGLKPYFFEMDQIESLDIDYEDDFLLAESIFMFRMLK
jgi:CMP-N-acetylneuraminic acid synthetase